MTPRRVMITGGMRSGKSRFAEGLLADQPHVTYIAPGPLPDPATDAEWAERIAGHRERRSASWTTLETTDIAGAIRTGAPPFLIDCLGSWLTATIDRLGTWEQPLNDWREQISIDMDELLEAWRACSGPAFAVTNEVGWGLVSEHRSGRVFTDLLGQLNARFAEASDTVYLVVAGRSLRL
jgi:adenosylcobinamide kinase / adenosylcobinamide-phosphate guanylyltransferase